MARAKTRRVEPREKRTVFDAGAFLKSAGATQRVATYPKGKISQETLAEMVGTTRSRVNFFMNKFRDLGFLEYNGDFKVNTWLLSVVLHD